MTEDTTIESGGAYSLSERKRGDLVAGLKETADEGESDSLRSLSERLNDAKQNAEKAEAWVSAIVPPEAELSDAPNRRDDEIAVEFLLGSDHTFWETYKFSETYLSDDNRFVTLVDHIGYDLNALEFVLGEKVDVVYNKTSEEWMVDPEIFGADETEDDGLDPVEDGISTGLGVAAVLGSIPLGLIILFLTIRTRGLALVGFGVIAVLVYVTYSVFFD